MKNLPRRRDGHVSRVPHTCSDIGRSIAALRSLRGMNQTALAAAAGIPGSAVPDYDSAAHRLASRFADTTSETPYQLLQWPRPSEVLGLGSAVRRHAAATAPSRPDDDRQGGHASQEKPRS
jgi:hypothetical protein